MTRTRKKKYAAAIEAIASEANLGGNPTDLISFHNAFSGFSAALKYSDASPDHSINPTPPDFDSLIKVVTLAW